jgi:opacity protein-like surface antigen
MSRKNSFATLVFTTAILCVPAFSQDEPGRSEASAQFFGTFEKGTTKDGVGQTSSKSGGILATYRFFFTKHHGVEGNYGYSRSTHTYNFTSGQTGFAADQHEVSAAYVFRMPMGRVSPFVESGIGALVFEPYRVLDASTQTRASFIYGGGLDINMTHHVFIRAQYRGFVYNTPDQELTAVRQASRVTHLAEPSVGFGFRF